jgi:hypothetical protein
MFWFVVCNWKREERKARKQEGGGGGGGVEGHTRLLPESFSNFEAFVLIQRRQNRDLLDESVTKR